MEVAKRRGSVRLRLVGSIVLALFAMACGGGGSGVPVKRVADIKGRKLIIGTDSTYPPMEYLEDTGDPKGPQVAGFDVEVMVAIASLINAKVEWTSLENFNKAFDALANRQIDVLISSVSVTPEREKIVAFSNSYLSVGQVILSRADDDTVTAPEHIAFERRVGFQTGTTGEAEAVRLGVAAENQRGYGDIQMAYHDLVYGEIDVVVTDGPAAQHAVEKSNFQIHVAVAPFTTEQYAIAVQNDDPELLAAINMAIAELKADGTLQALITKYNLVDVATIP